MGYLPHVGGPPSDHGFERSGAIPVSLWLVVTDVQIFDFDGDTGRVRVIFRHATDRRLSVANNAGGTERWDYVAGGWVNRTCEYSEGPSLWQLIADGTIQLAEE